MASDERRGFKQLRVACGWSMNGLRETWRTEASFRLEVYVAIVVVPLGLWLGNGPVQKVMLAGAWMTVIAAELLNTAIEDLVNAVSPEFNAWAGRAKDIASAATFVLMMLTLLTWAVILGMRWL